MPHAVVPRGPHRAFRAPHADRSAPRPPRPRGAPTAAALGRLAASVTVSVASLVGASAHPLAALQPQPDPCATTAEAPVLQGSYCAPLVPVPDLRHVEARLELVVPAGPFGAVVTRDGRARATVRIAVDGLPDPADRGGVEYVAWVTNLALGDPERLGPIRNGVNTLGEVARNQFRILVSAEPRPGTTRREGPLVLRGTSPSVGLLAHRDAFVTAGLPGLGVPMDGGAGPAAPGWTMPPMRPGMGMGAMPGVRGRRPARGPYLPAPAGRDVSALPLVRPRELRDAEDGDTLRLEAGLVRKVVGSRTLVMLAYNGQHPGPLIRVDQGATITVVFRNRLDQPSAVHWHGLRLDNRYDGAPGVTQDPVEAGDDFVYEVHFPDAGIYWYHPHVREDVQQDLGLYGNMLVLPGDGSDLPPVDREVVLSVDDLLLDGSGELVPFGDDEPVHALMGRFGNTFLLNGEPDWSMEAAAGEVVRFHLTNVSNARSYNLSLAGPGDATPRLKLIGSDVGLFEREAWVESVVIAPAERYTVDVRFDDAGTVHLLNRVQGVNHMSGSYLPLVDTLGSVVVSGPPAGEPRSDVAAAFDTLRAHPDAMADIASFRTAADRPVDHRLELFLRAEGPARTFLAETASGYAPPMEWNDGMPMMNWLTSGGELAWTIRDPDTGLENMAIDWRFAVGDVVKVRITNRSDELHPMNHPFHLHGQRFLVLSRNGVERPNLVWKDTAIVGAGETVDLLVEMSNPGRWMAHCHIAEHLSTGMMMTFEVEAGGP